MRRPSRCKEQMRRRTRGGQQRLDASDRRVDGRDHDQRRDVVDDDNGEHEGAQPIGKPRPDEGEQTERERRVGRHRDPPTVRRAIVRR